MQKHPATFSDGAFYKGDPRLRGDDILAAYRLISPSVSLLMAS